ncbi:Interferon-induced 35 kDa protein, partial [Opisthocomus hoazin]
MLPALPEKKMVFKGLVTNKEDMNKLVLTPLIRCPLLGGSALITFEKAEARPMAALRCAPGLRGRPCPALAPTSLCHVQIGLTRSRRSILVSDLPSLGIPEEALLDKLELFFSKTKNGGGEVESRDFLDDSGQVVLTFAQDGVAEPLLARGRIQVPIGKGKYELKISPCMSGDVTNLQV